ncbi:MAG: exo-alpha-sialidase [Candidatus Eisenbacteria bacterium]|uniref:Exo-alpha-sialidase n=1 Tax=Eiseniibacteriota bacterium TaxID=2212470 RepID=A0A956SBK1_UNCEI|nr:exo-alpha-sialidase [Candidatus Eisenbacteria bacterium]
MLRTGPQAGPPRGAGNRRLLTLGLGGLALAGLVLGFASPQFYHAGTFSTGVRMGASIESDIESAPAAEVAPGSRGMAGIPPELKTQPPLVGPVVSTEGVRIDPGSRDELGYRLPLDVIYRDGDRNTTSPPGADETPLQNGRGTASEGSPTLTSPVTGSPFAEERLGPDDGHTQNETSIDVDGSTLIAGWNQYTSSSLVMGVGRSADGGGSWTSTSFGGHTVMSDPAVKSAGGGVWFYGYLASGGSGGSDVDIYVRRSSDDGATWSTPVDASGNSTFDDKPYIAARGSEVLVGWADFGFSPAKVRTARSLDGGLTFGANTILSNNSTAGNGACPVIAPNGDYFVFWRDSFQDSLWVSRSTNQGTSWSADRGIVEMNPLPSTLPGGFRIVNLPSAAADPLTGDLLVVWNDQLFGNPDILAVRSTDNGVTWSSPVRVNDDGGTGAQWFPWVAFDPNGVAHVVWYDRRNDPSDIDVYYARSVDGGASFEANVRVTGSGFPVVLPNDTTLDFIGDYNGIAASASTVYPFYQDSRRGEQDVWVARIPNDVTAVTGDDTPSGGWNEDTAVLRMRAEPNPSRGEVSLEMSFSRDANASAEWSAGSSADGGSSPRTLAIFDASGRRVTSLALAEHDGGLRAVWDGTDEAGRIVPAGNYFARPQGLAGVRTEPLRIVRLP